MSHYSLDIQYEAVFQPRNSQLIFPTREEDTKTRFFPPDIVVPILDGSSDTVAHACRKKLVFFL